MVSETTFSNIPAAPGTLRNIHGKAPHQSGGHKPDGVVARQAAPRPNESQRDEQSRALPHVDREALELAVTNITKNAQTLRRSLEFSIDETSGRTVITVIDKEIQEVIRQIPQEELLHAVAQIGSGLGVLVAAKA
jgi:flagellar protein FlaG